MKKGFKFKLNGVLKLRKLKEDRCKMEIGRIQVRINELNRFEEEHSHSIDESYRSQEIALGSEGMNGQEARFHPFFIQGKRAHMEVIRRERADLQEELKEKYRELAQYRADVKLFEKMEEKERTKYKKELQKKEFEQLEEQVQNWKAFLK